MISSLQIKNYKCFRNQQLSFNKLNVFAGGNAVGKSTIIQAILLMRQAIDNAIKGNFKKNIIDLNNSYCLKLGNTFEIVSSNSNDDFIEFSVNDGKIVFNFPITKSSAQQLYIECTNLSEDNFLDAIKANISLFNEEFHYLNAERIGPRLFQNMAVQSFPNVGFQGEYTGYAIASNESKEIALEKRHYENLEISQLHKQIEFWLDFIIPGVQFRTNKENDFNLVQMSLRRPIFETDFLNPNNLGFGISYSLPIIASGLLSSPNTLLIVENPEAHLHPSGQSHMGRFLAKIAASGTQVIIETHSEHIVNGIRIAALKKEIYPEDVNLNFFGIAKDKKEIEIKEITMNNKSELSSWPVGFLDQEEQDLAEMFQLRRDKKC